MLDAATVVPVPSPRSTPAPGSPKGARDPGAPEPSDAELVRQVASGERDALATLYGRHAPWLVLRLTRRCNDPHLVDEAVQDTFVAVWKGARRWNGQGEVAAWIWGIGIRRLIDQLRRQPRPTAELTDLTATEPEPSAEERVLLGVEHGDLAGALHKLSPELRAVVQATILDGLTTREAAKLLGIPAGTVKTRMMRAKAQMREALA
jgi:RNA polymerase sigma-70 factor, ECF subfamily